MPRLAALGQKGQTLQFLINFKSEIRHSVKFVPHKIRPKMRVPTYHFFATVSDRLLNYLNRGSSHDQGAYSVVPEAVHTATFEPEFAKQWM
jgi:hypothetical protein